MKSRLKVTNTLMQFSEEQGLGIVTSSGGIFIITITSNSTSVLPQFDNNPGISTLFDITLSNEPRHRETDMRVCHKKKKKLYPTSVNVSGKLDLSW